MKLPQVTFFSSGLGGIFPAGPHQRVLAVVSDLVGLAEHGVSPQVEYIHLTVVEEKKGVLLHEVAGGAGVPRS